jgi:hypothetical protein
VPVQHEPLLPAASHQQASSSRHTAAAPAAGTTAVAAAVLFPGLLFALNLLLLLLPHVLLLLPRVLLLPGACQRTSRNSMTPSRAFLTSGVSVLIFMPGPAGMAHDATGLGLFSTCTMRAVDSAIAVESRLNTSCHQML